MALGLPRRPLAILVVMAAILTLSAPPVQAQPPPTATPLRCRVGVYLIDLYDLDPTAKTFTADFWLWSICPTATYRPLDALEFVNATAVTTQLHTFAPA